MGIFSKLKKAVKKGLEFNKDVFSGKIVRKAIKSGAKFAQKNPELTGAALGFATGNPALFGGLFGGGTSPNYPSYAPEPPPPQDTGQEPQFQSPIPTQYLLIGGAVVVAVLLLRKK